MRVANFCFCFKVMNRKPQCAVPPLSSSRCDRVWNHTVFFCYCVPYLCHISNGSRFGCSVEDAYNCLGRELPGPARFAVWPWHPLCSDLVGTVIDKPCREQSGIAPPLHGLYSSGLVGSWTMPHLPSLSLSCGGVKICQNWCNLEDTLRPI